MEKEDLIKKLNWFYSLELNQVDLYHTQGKKAEPDIKQIFEHISDIEQTHVDNITAQIRKVGGTPSPLSDVVFPATGNLAGSVLSWSGVHNLLKADIMLEEHATKEYKLLIQELKEACYSDPELIKTLEGNCVDEQLHIAWFERRLSQLD